MILSYPLGIRRSAAFFLLFSALALAGISVGNAREPEPLPSSLFGSVTVEGGEVPAGTSVEAFLGGARLASGTVEVGSRVSVYRLHVLGLQKQPLMS